MEGYAIGESIGKGILFFYFKGGKHQVYWFRREGVRKKHVKRNDVFVEFFFFFQSPLFLSLLSSPFCSGKKSQFTPFQTHLFLNNKKRWIWNSISGFKSKNRGVCCN